MADIEKLRALLNRSVNGTPAAIIIVIAAITIPVCFLRDVDWKNVELSITTVLIPVLYGVAVAGMVFIVLGKSGPSITSSETDVKIANSYSKIAKKLAPIWWALWLGWGIWIVFLYWNMHSESRQGNSIRTWLFPGPDRFQ